MKIYELTVGIHPVKISDESGTVRFKLSVVSSCGLLGVAAFTGRHVPRKDKHLLLSDPVRDWIERMDYEANF